MPSRGSPRDRGACNAYTSISAFSRGALLTDGPAVVVDLQHELGGLLLRVAEELAEHVHDVIHEVHRVVPDDDVPAELLDGLLVGGRLIDSARKDGGVHAERIGRARDVPARGIA